jgi:hypothetical protein
MSVLCWRDTGSEDNCSRVRVVARVNQQRRGGARSPSWLRRVQSSWQPLDADPSVQQYFLYPHRWPMRGDRLAAVPSRTQSGFESHLTILGAVPFLRQRSGAPWRCLD